MTIWGLTLITFFLYIQASFTPNQKLNIPQNTHHILYTDNQQYVIIASPTKVSVYWGINGTYLRDLDLQNTEEVTTIAVSQTGRLIAVGFEDGQIQTHDWENY